MPPKKSKKKERTSEEDDHHLSQVDVQYNPDIVQNLLDDLERQVDAKCSQIQKDTDYMISSIRNAFQMEMIRLPKQVQEMSINVFLDNFDDSLDAVAKGSIAQLLNRSKTTALSSKENRMSQKVFQTPRHKANPQVMQTPSQRNPREGEEILSANGSPLGEFTVKKAPKNSKNMVPATPSVFVPLKTGAVVDIADLDDTEIDEMSQECKEDALNQMQAVMDNMQALMAKLGQK